MDDQLYIRETSAHLPLVLFQGVGISIYGVDHPFGPDQVGQGQCEGAAPGSQISPDAALSGDATSQQFDVRSVIHCGASVSA
jgi:hypothetical protein